MGTTIVSEDLILGLDLGVSSIGWSVLKINSNNDFSAIIDSGVRIFEPGMDGDISSGKADSHAIARRNARQIRRQTQRRARRKLKVLHILQKMNLLPQGIAKDIIPSIDTELLEQYRDTFNDSLELQLDALLPYWLRKKALDEKLTSYELGRIFYHLAQRRGFLSNRKSIAKDNEELGAVKSGISDLESEIKNSNSRTLGEYFASLNPHQYRIRQRWTHRDMYRNEFNAIWEAQKGYHDSLHDENHKILHHAMFHQRPLKSAKHLVGKCQLEPSCRRAPYATLEAQEFRLLSAVNNCQIITSDGEIRPFSDEERDKLLAHLHTDGDITFAQAKKLLGLKRNYKFTLEEGGESRFIGHRVNAELRKIFGDKWNAFNDEKKTLILNDLRCTRKQEVLYNRGLNIYGLDKQNAEDFSELELEDSYCNLSRKAIRKLLPLMQDAKMHFATAKKEIYGAQLQSGEPADILCPVNKFTDLRNPVVSRVLTELRKVMNNIVRKYGKPGRIRIELARDMKNNAKKRKTITNQNRDNEKKRKDAAGRIIAKTTIKNPRRDDILKVQLAEECNWKCPYTGKTITWKSLFGRSPSFDIEHIIPFSRSLDDSFLNKTLCDAHYNRNIKKNRAPGEYITSGSEEWDTIMGVVSRFKGDSKTITAKMRRFKMTAAELQELAADFSSNQLNDTRYASRLACDYLGQLYGGQVDSKGTRRIQAAKGGVTYYLREAWHLNDILGDGIKNRDDHRHHAIDAIAVALTTPGTIKSLSDATVQNYQRPDKKGRFGLVDMPWNNFWPDVKDSIDNIVVSHRVKHKINSQLHKDSNYAPVNVIQNGKLVKQTHLRRAVSSLKSKEVEQIVNPVVRQSVKDKLKELGTSNPAKAFASPDNHPQMATKNGRKIPIHKVRIKVSASPVKIGNSGNERFCTTGSNHHMEIYAKLDKNGNEIKWHAAVVSTLEAMYRKRKHLPIVNTDHGPDTKFKFSLAPGDSVKIKNPEKLPTLAHIRAITAEANGSKRICFVKLNDARLKSDILASKEYHRCAIDKFRLLGVQKVKISPLGEIWAAND